MSLVSRMLFTAADLLAAGVAVLSVVVLRKCIAAEAAKYHSDDAYEHQPEGTFPQSQEEPEPEPGTWRRRNQP